MRKLETLSEPTLGQPRTVLETPAPQRAILAKLGGDWLRFTLVAVEFGLLVLIIRLFALEGSGFGNLVVLAWAGFVIHHFLPLRWRMPFYVALSMGGLALVLGVKAAICVIGGGCILIGVCHLPIRLWMRIGLLVLLGGLGAATRLGWVTHTQPTAWPILAALFMFRLIIYVHDLRNKAAPFSPARAGAYFFMLPNVCFPFFPVVDYKTFCSTYYNGESIQIYQRGLRWMLRGIIHLLLYRLIYQYALINPMEVTSIGGVARFMVATYLLYLHVSGQFHLIIGLMHLFGFNLPETHHLYFLAGSFTDLWRRINIYWKDFIMKIFFYPAYFRLKRFGLVAALTLATLYAFVATWALHSYQWFWLRGSLFLTWQDILFWAILSVFVVANILYEAKWGRQRSLAGSQRTVGSLVGVALRTIGTFLTITILWTLWTCESVTELRWLATAATHGTVGEVALILTGLAGLGVAAILWGKSTQERTEKESAATDLRPAPLSLKPALGLGLTCAGLFVLAALGRAGALENSRAGEVLKAVQGDLLNRTDAQAQRRGYYEDLDVARRQTEIQRQLEAPPPDWKAGAVDLERPPAVAFQRAELIPSARGFFAGRWVTHNRWGMRSPECDKQKAPGVVRIAWLGSSHEYGTGVDDRQSYQFLLEDKLNREPGKHPRYEVLNFATLGQDVFQSLYFLDNKIWDFDPDVVCLSINDFLPAQNAQHLAKCIHNGWDIPFDYLREIVARAGVDSSMPQEVILVKLTPYQNEMVQHAFALFAEECRRRGVSLYLPFRPLTVPLDPWALRDQEEGKRLLQGFAAELSIPVLDMCPAFDQVRNRQEVIVAPWDVHTNERGHRLLADELFRLVHDNEGHCLFRPRTATVPAEKS
jgi:hypothetical protein